MDEQIKGEIGMLDPVSSLLPCAPGVRQTSASPSSGDVILRNSRDRRNYCWTW